MKKNFILRAGLSMVSAAALCSVSATAVADGLKSQFKSHVPTAPGMVKVLTEHEKLNAHGAPIVSNPTSDKEVIALIVHRNLRAARRREKWFGAGSKLTPKAKAEALSPVNSGNRADKIQLIRRGNTTLPGKCLNLHTHDRAVCMNQSQLDKMIRFSVDKH